MKHAKVLAAIFLLGTLAQAATTITGTIKTSRG
jgi:hypothetical protein